MLAMHGLGLVQQIAEREIKKGIHLFQAPVVPKHFITIFFSTRMGD